jgi:DNA (cytosine-5)-methyltransferase 1
MHNKYFIDLFSGIGGFALGAYWAGLRFNKHYFSEIDLYNIELYQKRFPEAEHLGDIRNVNYSKLPKGQYLITAGFPCQPHSLAGLKKAADDQRDLWPECARMLRELRPAIALFENVRGLLTSPGRKRRGEFFNGVLSDIYSCGFDAEWQVISARDAGAPHLRKRIWIVAYSKEQQGYVDRQTSPFAGRRGEVLDDAESERCGNGYDRANQQQTDRKINSSADSSFSCGTQSFTNTDNTASARQRKHGGKIYAETETEMSGKCSSSEWWAVEPDVGRVANGIPSRVDRLRGCGNAVVPQCVEMIF